jgi:hypothetical protein
MLMNNELQRMQMEAVFLQYEVLTRNLRGGAEENHLKPQLG